MQQIRSLNQIEKRLLQYLIAKAELYFPEVWYEELLVQPLDDGGMGSFKIYNNQTHRQINKKFSRQVSEFEFIDDDGVKVSISLNLDDQNNPFEVDIWKIDFNPVLNLKVP